MYQSTAHGITRWIKEPFSAISHGLGAALAIAASVALLILARGHVWHTISFAIYGLTLILLYTASTLYHGLVVKPQTVEQLKRFDHVCIFLLIAGTYTPVCMVPLHGTIGWTLLAIEWGLALTGVVTTLLWKGVPDWFRIVIYICMGWMIVTAMAPIRTMMTPSMLWWLFAGGVTYTIGTVVFATDRPKLWPGRFGAHELWHLFVLGGSVCHFVMMTQFAQLPA